MHRNYWKYIAGSKVFKAGVFTGRRLRLLWNNHLAILMHQETKKILIWIKKFLANCSAHDRQTFLLEQWSCWTNTVVCYQAMCNTLSVPKFKKIQNRKLEMGICYEIGKFEHLCYHQKSVLTHNLISHKISFFSFFEYYYIVIYWLIEMKKLFPRVTKVCTYCENWTFVCFMKARTIKQDWPRRKEETRRTCLCNG